MTDATDDELKAMATQLEEMNAFIDGAVDELVGIAPIEGNPDQVAQILKVAVRSSGMAALFEALDKYGPNVIMMFMLAETERLAEGILFKKQDNQSTPDRESGVTPEEGFDLVRDEDVPKILH